MTENTSGTIVFVTRTNEDGQKVYVTDTWPAIAHIILPMLDGIPVGVAVLNGDDLSFVCANGTAKYLKTDQAEDGTLTFELVESTYDPMPEEPAAPPPDVIPEQEADAAQVINTDVADRPVHPTVVQMIAAASHAAQVAGDAPRHAALHNLEVALGEFKRAAKVAESAVDPESELGYFLHATARL